MIGGCVLNRTLRKDGISPGQEDRYLGGMWMRHTMVGSYGENIAANPGCSRELGEKY